MGYIFEGSEGWIQINYPDDITVQPEQVTIRGERKESKEVEEDQYHAHECFWGTFSRMVMLPVEGDPDRARATFKHGILTITPHLASLRQNDEGPKTAER